jgi:hypothetical protein
VPTGRANALQSQARRSDPSRHVPKRKKIDCFASLAMPSASMGALLRDLATRSVRGLLVISTLSNKRGRRESRVPIAPMGPVQKKHGSRTTGSTGSTPAFPARWFTAYFALSSATGLFCHRHLSRELLRAKNLAPASGCQDHTTSLVRDNRVSSCAAVPSTASHRNARDDRDPPLIRVRRRSYKADLQF